ncbi:Alanine--tRNA ligase [Bienertia sinuspersici]
MDRLFFDHKPIMLKAWRIDMNLTNDDIYDIPIWVHLDLNFKYWGEKCLEKTIRPLGNSKNWMHILFKERKSVNFINEKKEVTIVPIVYEWRPEVCSRCKRIGHVGKDCYAKPPKQRKQWINQKPSSGQEEAESGVNENAGPSNDTIIEDKSGNKVEGGNSLKPHG